VLPDSGCGHLVHRPDPDRRHLKVDETWDYATFPPTAGPHDADSLPSGTYHAAPTEAAAGTGGVTWTRIVHSLEHGYVVIVHEDDTAPDEVADWVQRHLPDGKLISVPAGRGMERPIALLAWERLMWCADAEHPVMDAFLNAYRAGPTAPEPEGP